MAMDKTKLAKLILDQVVVPMYTQYQLPKRMETDAANALLLAIGLQESGLQKRDQLEQKDGTNKVLGPALGLWQFERGGGVRGVMTHSASKGWSQVVCMAGYVPWEADAIWRGLLNDDKFAAAMARLLLWTDTRPIPAIGAVDKAWDYYIRCWNPGKPHRDRWTENYEAAVAAVGNVQ